MTPSFRFVKTNGIMLRVALYGNEGPLVVLVHGWPESWYSWRHQMTALAESGYRVVVPDMRGFGESDAPGHVSDYRIDRLTADVAGLVEVFRTSAEEKAILVGHDWGAIVAWHAVLMYPDHFSALVAMSVPYGGRPSRSPIVYYREKFGDRFFYMLYHQEPGVAEAEYDADPAGILSRLYQSPDSPREPPQVTERHHAAGGWIPRLGAPKGLPAWLSKEDLDYFVAQYRKSGFRGGINYYRNLHSNWEFTESLQDARVVQPTLFIAGAKDNVIHGASQAQLEAAMKRVVNDLRGVVLFPEAGHWIQQELPQETNKALLDFLQTL